MNAMRTPVSPEINATAQTPPESRPPRRPRVVMVLESMYPPTRGGGAEAQVRTLSRAMRKRHQRVMVVVPLNRHGPQEAVSRVDGVPVCRLRYPRLRVIGGPALWLVLALFLFGRRHRYDVWHIHMARSWAVLCALLGPVMGKRTVVKISGSADLERGPLAPGGNLVERIAYRCLRRIDRWQAISQRIAGFLRERMPAERVGAVPNAVDVARFADTVHPAGAARFIFIGRLVPEKGIPTLLEAFCDTVADFPGIHLTIVGTGPLMEELQARASALGLSESVSFTGHRDDVQTLLASANVGVLPSHFEGLSNALLESMASGLPMVASRISGNEDFVIEGHNGWLFEPADRVGLSRCLAAAARLTPDERRAMGENARGTVARQAGIDQVLDQLVTLYSDDAAASPAVGLSQRRA